VFCQVYRLRCEAGKLPRDDVRQTLRRGWLEYVRSPIGAPTWSAQLLTKPGGQQVAELTVAHVRFIRQGGIMIRGFEAVPDPNMTRSIMQSWWCVPTPPTSS
jgi:hypothetical protein